MSDGIGALAQGFAQSYAQYPEVLARKQQIDQNAPVAAANVRAANAGAAATEQATAFGAEDRPLVKERMTAENAKAKAEAEATPGLLKAQTEGLGAGAESTRVQTDRMKRAAVWDDILNEANAATAQAGAYTAQTNAAAAPAKIGMELAAGRESIASSRAARTNRAEDVKFRNEQAARESERFYASLGQQDRLAVFNAITQQQGRNQQDASELARTRESFLASLALKDAELRGDHAKVTGSLASDYVRAGLAPDVAQQKAETFFGAYKGLGDRVSALAGAMQKGNPRARAAYVQAADDFKTFTSLLGSARDASDPKTKQRILRMAEDGLAPYAPTSQPTEQKARRPRSVGSGMLRGRGKKTGGDAFTKELGKGLVGTEETKAAPTGPDWFAGTPSTESSKSLVNTVAKRSAGSMKTDVNEIARSLQKNNPGRYTVYEGRVHELPAGDELFKNRGEIPKSGAFRKDDKLTEFLDKEVGGDKGQERLAEAYQALVDKGELDSTSDTSDPKVFKKVVREAFLKYARDETYFNPARTPDYPGKLIPKD